MLLVQLLQTLLLPFPKRSWMRNYSVRRAKGSVVSVWMMFTLVTRLFHCRAATGSTSNVQAHGSASTTLVLSVGKALKVKQLQNHRTAEEQIKVGQLHLPRGMSTEPEG